MLLIPQPNNPTTDAPPGKRGVFLAKNGAELVRNSAKLVRNGANLPRNGTELPGSGADLGNSGAKLVESRAELGGDGAFEVTDDAALAVAPMPFEESASPFLHPPRTSMPDRFPKRNRWHGSLLTDGFKDKSMPSSAHCQRSMSTMPARNSIICTPSLGLTASQGQRLIRELTRLGICFQPIPGVFDQELEIEFHRMPMDFQALIDGGFFEHDGKLHYTEITPDGVGFWYALNSEYIGDGLIFVPMSNIVSIRSPQDASLLESSIAQHVQRQQSLATNQDNDHSKRGLI